MSVLIALLAIFVSIIFYVGYLSKKANSYWKEKGVPYVEPYLFVGNALDVILMRMSVSEAMAKVCERFPDEPIVGFVSFIKPAIIVQDSNYAEMVLVKDFSHFLNRGFEMNESLSPLQLSLFNMTGEKWRTIRNKLSPIFTSGKLKKMFNEINEIGDDFDKTMSLQQKECVDLRDVMNGFTLDTLGFYGFGKNPKTLLNPNNEFKRMAGKVFNFGIFQFVKFMINVYFPYLTRKLRIFFIDAKVQNFFIDFIANTVNERTEKNVERNDFIELMLQLKNKGSVELQSKDSSDDYLGIEENKIIEKIEFTDDILLGQAFVFLVAGYEAFSTSLTLTFRELSQNQNIQDRLRAEINEKIKKHGSINYDAIKEMTYLDMCLQESLRRYPPVRELFRVCTKSYTFPNGVTVEKNQNVTVLVPPIHMNPKIFPEPEKYVPERFHPDVEQKPCTNLAFGYGPRMCIAMRFTLLQLKYAIIKTITTYKLEYNPKTRKDIRNDPKALVVVLKDPIYFNLTKID